MSPEKADADIEPFVDRGARPSLAFAPHKTERLTTNAAHTDAGAWKDCPLKRKP